MAKRMPDMGEAPRHAPTRGAAEAQADPAETRLRKGARRRRISVDRIRDSAYQSASRRALEDVQDLVASIRELGLLHPPVVRKLQGGEWELLSGHRRVRAYRLLVQTGEASRTIPVDVHETMNDLEAALALRAANGHRDVGPVAEAEETGEIRRILTAELGREPTVRDLAAAMPKGKTAVSEAIEIWRALQDPRIGPLVRLADKAGKSMLVKCLRAERFSTTKRALAAFGEGGVTAMRKTLAAAKGGRPTKPFTRRTRGKEGSYDLTLRVRPSMPPEDAERTLEEVRAVEQDLLRIVGEGASDGTPPDVAS